MTESAREAAVPEMLNYQDLRELSGGLFHDEPTPLDPLTTQRKVTPRAEAGGAS
ncbi:hypothetical protein [Tessaracoccus defluvii]|uniref:Uncharacterized protein n=1 Tax=Tessaracoccus defluvii TaxID=1285901 RepID=A0A7H0H265_9ACTN|nr:hypothetical protein [Tessaracoccus defluvii]QNP54631.1 hypothetical protein H9L22_09855 [Tessaracoccus defluvii]